MVSCCLRFASKSFIAPIFVAGITNPRAFQPWSLHQAKHFYPTVSLENIMARLPRQSGSGVPFVRARVPRLVRVHITGILDLAHGWSTATNAATQVGATATAIHHVDGEGGDESSPAEPQEGAGSLCLAAVLLCVGRGVADAVCEGVCLWVHMSID